VLDWSIPLWADGLVFGAAAAVIAVAGVRTAGFADRLADRTGLGEAITGTVFLGLITAVPGLAASVIAALKGHPALAISNAMGGIAVQTAALAVADLAHPKANLEHAAASVPNMMQTIMLLLLLTLTLVAVSGPDAPGAAVHPATFVLCAAAGFAFWIVNRTRRAPMWKPEQTDETVRDVPDRGAQRQSLGLLVTGMVVAGGLTAAAGAAVAESAANLVEGTAIPEVVVGGLFMAVATSLPEIVTSTAAVRRGALTLAVSDIVGGNFFDVLFVAAADFAFLHGSLYHAPGVGLREVFLIALTILLNLVLLMGLVYRQKRGPINIGLESVGMVVIYIAGFLVLSLAM